MDIQNAKLEIERTVKAYLAKDEGGNYRIPALRQRPILLMGPPGVGKTQIVAQAAQECGVALVAYTITHHTRQSAVGLPFIRERNFNGKTHSITEYTMSEIIASVYSKMEQTGLRQGILFIDEINCVSETLAPTMLQFLQYKTFGNQAVPEGWIIVTAGNPPEYNKSVREFDLVTLDRVRRIDVEPSLPAWQTYARTQRLHPAILAYLELRPKHFYKVEQDVDGARFVTARGWEDLSAMLLTCEALNLPVNQDLIGEYLRHTEVARDFAAYWALYKKYHEDYGVENILQGKPFDAVVERAMAASFDERLSLVSLLISGLNVRFSNARKADAITDACYQMLRAYKRGLDHLAEGETPAALLNNQCGEAQARLEAGISTGRVLPSEAGVHRQALALMDGWAQTVASSDTVDEAFDRIRAKFNHQVHKREDAVAAASNALEFAFDFMERAFGDQQEMVVFVNELALGPDSASFLAENECLRFDKYSKTLLLDEKRDELLAELERDELRRSEHSQDF